MTRCERCGLNVTDDEERVERRGAVEHYSPQDCIDRLRAEVEAMRPVVDAARAAARTMRTSPYYEAANLAHVRCDKAQALADALIAFDALTPEPTPPAPSCPACRRPVASEDAREHGGQCDCAACAGHCFGEGTVGCEREVRIRAAVARPAP